jgi:transcriptional regulator with XRE-family HTH domain
MKNNMKTRRRKRIDCEDWERIHSHKYQVDVVIRINEIMEEKEWSQKKLAEQAGWSQARVSEILSGGSNLTLKTIAKLEAALDADVLDVPLEEDKAHETTIHGLSSKFAFAKVFEEVTQQAVIGREKEQDNIHVWFYRSEQTRSHDQAKESTQSLFDNEIHHRYG